MIHHLFQGNSFVYVYKLGMALKLQLRVCLAITLSSVLSNCFFKYTIFTSYWTLNLKQAIPSAPYFFFFCMLIKIMAVFWLVKKIYFCSLKMECKISEM